MKRRSVLHYILELIVITGFLVLGMTILSYISNRMPFDRFFIGAIVLTTGVLELTDYCTWKYATRMRSIQALVSALLSIALGAVFIFAPLEKELICTLWGAFSIVFALVKISTGAVNIAYQPLLCSIKIILSIIQVVFGILLIVRGSNLIYSHMMFLFIAYTISSITLFVEFIIHRYQRI